MAALGSRVESSSLRMQIIIDCSTPAIYLNDSAAAAENFPALHNPTFATVKRTRKCSCSCREGKEKESGPDVQCREAKRG